MVAARKAKTTEGDQALRREMKFAFEERDRERVLDILSAVMEPIRFAASDVSRVNSIYFDDDRLSSVYESMSGISRRAKVRLRWYDREGPAGKCHLEIKRRSGSTGWKYRTAVNVDEAAGGSYQHLVGSLFDQVGEPSSTWLAMRQTPVMLVRYWRRHFVDRETGARVSVDWNVEGVDQLGQMRPVTAFPVALANYVVMEVKSDLENDVRAVRAVERLISRPTRFSKYVMCCARMGWTFLDDRHD